MHGEIHGWPSTVSFIPVAGAVVMVCVRPVPEPMLAVKVVPAAAWKPGPMTIWLPARNVAPAPPLTVKPLVAVMLWVAW
jgi:hypothetical protein